MDRADGHGPTPTLVAVCLGTFMLLVDVTIVTVALPAIRVGIDADLAEARWTISAYALTLAALLLPTGSLADIVGARRVFAGGMIAFTAGSLLCGVATAAVELAAFRAVQGLGGAAVLSTSLALLAQSFTGAARGRAFGIWGAVVSTSIAVAPVLGGVLTSALSWRWIFFVNVPFGIAAVLIALFRMRAAPPPPERRRFDLPGSILFGTGLVAVIVGLTAAGSAGWVTPIVLVPFAAGIALLVAFPFVERRRPNPIFRVALLRIPSFTGGLIAGFGLNATLYAMLVYLVVYLQDGLHTSPLGVGSELLVITGGSVAASFPAGRLLTRIPPGWLLGGGLAMIGVGLMLMRDVGPGVPWTRLVPGFVLAGVGSGMVNPALGATAVGVVAPAEAGMASGMNSAVRQVGVAASVAVLGSIWNLRLGGGASSAAEEAAALQELLLISAVAALVAALLAVLLVRRRDLDASAT